LTHKITLNYVAIVVEPVEAKTITDLPTVAKSNTDLSIRIEHNRQFQLLIYVCRGRREVRYHIADYAEKFQ
jgi:hypothetical protein